MINKYLNKIKKTCIKKLVKKISVNDCTNEFTTIFKISSNDFKYKGYLDIFGKKWFDEYIEIVPEGYVLHIPNGVFRAQEETVYTQSGKLIAEISSQHYNPMLDKLVKIKNEEYIDGIVVDLGLDCLDNNYYHFNIEFLMRWWMFKLTNIECDYYVCSSNLSFSKQFYKLIGIEQDKLLIREKGTFIRARELIVPSLVNNWELVEWRGYKGCWKKYLPSWGRDVHKYILENNNLIAQNNSKRVYISRNKGKYRIIENEEALLEILNRYGFDTYYLEEMSVVEQISLFQQSAIIIAAHGAGLVNMVYCRENAILLEIFPEHYNDPGYRVIASIMNIDYNYMITSSKNVKTAFDIAQHENIFIDDLGSIESFIRGKI